KVAAADATQSHSGARLFAQPLVEQLRRCFEQWLRLLSRGVDRALPRVSLEVLATNLHYDGLGEPSLRAQARSRAIGQSRKLGAQLNAIGDVRVERFFGGDLLFVPVGDDRALVDAGSARLDVGHVTAEHGSQYRSARGASITAQ